MEKKLKIIENEVMIPDFVMPFRRNVFLDYASLGAPVSFVANSFDTRIINMFKKPITLYLWLVDVDGCVDTFSARIRHSIHHSTLI